jgi:hypothetical protein
VGTFQEARLSLILTLGRYKDKETEEREKVEKEIRIMKTNAQFADTFRNSESIKYQNLPVVLEALKSCVGDFDFTSDLDLGPHAESDSDSVFNFKSDFNILLNAIQKDKEVEVEVEEEKEVVMNVNLT